MYASSGGKVGKVGKTVGSEVGEGDSVAVEVKSIVGDAVAVFIRGDSVCVFRFIQLARRNKISAEIASYFFDVIIYFSLWS